MTPEERNLVTDCSIAWPRWKTPRAIARPSASSRTGCGRPPTPLYALVQTALIQDEALKRADARIRELEAQLGSRRRAAAAGRLPRRHARAASGDAARSPRAGSVPTVRRWLGAESASDGRPTAPYRADAQPTGTAPDAAAARRLAARSSARRPRAAAGVIGGSLLIRQHPLDDGRHRGRHRPTRPHEPAGGGQRSPWGGNSSSSDDNLAREPGSTTSAAAAAAAVAAGAAAMAFRQRYAARTQNEYDSDDDANDAASEQTTSTSSRRQRLRWRCRRRWRRGGDDE